MSGLYLKYKYAYLRRLENVYVNSSFGGYNSQSIIKYLCKAQIETANLEQIKLKPDLNFLEVI